MAPLNQSEKRCIQVSAPGKVILFGEHSVVYNKLAIAASLGLRTRLKLETLERSAGIVAISLPALNFSIKYDLKDVLELVSKPLNLVEPESNYNFTTPHLLDFEKQTAEIGEFVKNSTKLWRKLSLKEEQGLIALFYLISGILGAIQFELEPFLIEITTDLTVSAGTGSSASFCVCIAAALLKFIQVEKLPVKKGFRQLDSNINSLESFDGNQLELVSKWGYEGERVLHGTPSGIDNTICTFGSLIEFYKGSKPKLVKISVNLKVILINTNVPRDTKQLVASVATLRSKYGKIIDGMLETMNEIAGEAIECIKRIDRGEGEENYLKLSELARVNHSLLNGLGVGHAKLDEACLILRKHGLCGKLTGAGGGGYAISFVSPGFPGRVEDVLSELNGHGCTSVFTDLGGEGVKLEHF